MYPTFINICIAARRLSLSQGCLFPPPINFIMCGKKCSGYTAYYILYTAYILQTCYYIQYTSDLIVSYPDGVTREEAKRKKCKKKTKLERRLQYILTISDNVLSSCMVQDILDFVWSSVAPYFKKSDVHKGSQNLLFKWIIYYWLQLSLLMYVTKWLWWWSTLLILGNWLDHN